MEQKYTGIIKMLGNASVRNGRYRYYSVIEIGNQIITGMGCSSGLDNYLSRAFDSGTETTLYAFDSDLLAIANGEKVYLSKHYAGCLVTFLMKNIPNLIVGFVFSFIIIGLFFLKEIYEEFKKECAMKQLKAMYPNAIAV